MHAFICYLQLWPMQILMSVPEILTTVMGMPPAPTLWETTTVPVMRDMKEVVLKTIARVGVLMHRIRSLP